MEIKLSFEQVSFCIRIILSGKRGVSPGCEDGVVSLVLI